MLRCTTCVTLRAKASRRLSFTPMGPLALVCMALAGFGGSASSLAQDAPAPAEASSEALEAVERIGLEVVPPNSVGVVAVRPGELLARPELQVLASYVREIPALKATGVQPTEIAEALYTPIVETSGATRFAIRFTTEDACQKICDYIAGKRGMQPLVDSEFPGWEDAKERVVRYDSTTLVIDLAVREQRPNLPPVKNRPSTWADEWQQHSDAQVVAAFDALYFRQTILPQLMKAPGGSFPLAAVKPLIDQTDFAVASLQLGEELKIEGLAIANDAESATRVGKTIEALLQLTDNMLQFQREWLLEQTPPKAQDSVRELTDLGHALLTESKIEVTESRVTLRYSGKHRTLPLLASLAQYLLPSAAEAREAARRNVSLNNLKALALGLHNYHAAYNKLPSAVIRKEGQPPHSWRVAILPYLDEVELYNQYRFDEPWDSQANKKVLVQMPSVFRDPGDTSADPTATSYFALTGPSTMFEGEQGTTFRQVSDGLSNTILLVEAKRNIPWTKPEDIPYSPDQPLPKLGGNHPGCFLAVNADGSVHVFANGIDEVVLRALIARNGGETTSRPLPTEASHAPSPPPQP